VNSIGARPNGNDERASGVPRPTRFGASGVELWAALVGVVVLSLLGAVFWLAIKL
jgi:hypothetical protein